MKRQRQRKPRTTRRAVPAPGPVPEPEAPADARIRSLLERYCTLAGVKHAARGGDLSELKVPEAERPFFRDRASLRVAFSLDALERDPDAELAVLGSPLLSQLIDAIRSRAARLSLGPLTSPLSRGSSPPVSLSPSLRSGQALRERGDELDELAIPVRDGVAKLQKRHMAVHPVGRLVARVVLRAGAGVEESVVESDVFDLSAGTRVADDVAAAFRDLEAGRVEAADPSALGKATLIPAREPADLLRLLASHLQEKLAEQVAARRAAAEQALAAELGRLDRYFKAILAEQSSDAAIATVTALAERRRAEEIRRSQVRAVVHPLQLIEASVVIERGEWLLESDRGRKASFSAQRSLGGDWTNACPHCGRPPALLVICRHEHGACDACSHRCSVCDEDFCHDHGVAQCRVDARPVCDEHVRVCPSCRLEHCTAHEAVCSADGHNACSACLAPCGSCGRVICNRHAEQSDAGAPKGSRRLCAECLRHCEGGANEPVGADEVAECASCGKPVCTAHASQCAVDGHVHCSQHLRRTDRSHRLVCTRHRVSCALEPMAVFATDELETCPVCGKGTCTEHLAVCSYCGRQVCMADLNQESGHCATCAQLAATPEPPREAVTAARVVTGGTSKSSRWRVARDRTHLVVEVDLGFRRKAVVTMRPGGDAPESVVKHSLLGSKRRR